MRYVLAKLLVSASKFLIRLAGFFAIRGDDLKCLFPFVEIKEIPNPLFRKRRFMLKKWSVEITDDFSWSICNNNISFSGNAYNLVHLRDTLCIYCGINESLIYNVENYSTIDEK